MSKNIQSNFDFLTLQIMYNGKVYNCMYTHSFEKMLIYDTRDKVNEVKITRKSFVSDHESGTTYTSSSWECERMERLHAGSLLYIASSGMSHCKYKSSSVSLVDLRRNNKRSRSFPHHFYWCKIIVRQDNHYANCVDFPFPDSIPAQRNTLSLESSVWLIEFEMLETKEQEVTFRHQPICLHIIHQDCAKWGNSHHSVSSSTSVLVSSWTTLHFHKWLFCLHISSKNDLHGTSENT